MANRIVIKDKTFKTYISHKKILERVVLLAEQINKDYENKSPVFIAVLNGSFFFASDLLKNISLACEITFVKLASYIGTKSTGKVKEIIGLSNSISGRDIIIIEDIVDTGKTMKSLLYQLSEYYPDSIKVATLLFKKEALTEDINPDYVGFEISNEFVVGYGLDYDQLGRNFKDIYIVDI